MSDTIEATEIVNDQALATRQAGALGAALPPEQIQVKSATSQELRVVEVGEALLPAYQKASTLQLSESEIAALMADFPDEAVEIRPHDGLIYLPHINISNRLNQVLKPGQWSLVCRRHWLDGNTMYGEYVLLIRGRYVGESVGGHPYQPNNPKTNYSDTLESTAAEALRRIAGKRLSCGSQCWIPEYARNWVAKYGVQSGGKWSKRSQSNQPPRAAAPAPARPAAPVSAPTPAAPKPATEKTREWFLANVGNEEYALQFCIDLTWLMPNEKLADLGLRFVPTSQEQLNAFKAHMGRWVESGRAEPPYKPGDIEAPPAAAPTSKPAPASEPAKPATSNGARQQITGTLSHITEKGGTSKKGPWKLYGIKVGDSWFNTFSDTLGASAKALEGQQVTLLYEVGEKGNNAVAIEAA